MRIDYAKFNPTGNTTILVSTPVPRAQHGAVAAALLQKLGGEQVGYIEPPVRPEAAARLQMMGGEFCGNATMSLGAQLCRLNPPQGPCFQANLEVSGMDGLVPCRVNPSPAGGWEGTVRMPPPTRVDTVVLPTDAGPLSVPLVALPGITHLILPAEAGLDDAQLLRRLPEWNGTIGADALGALTWDEAAQAIDPLVYVPASGTLVREHGCGSGSAAVGCWLALRDGHGREVGIRQPGGTISVDVRIRDGAFTSVTITGQVVLVEEGQVEIP